jgi:manganese oxidase
MTADRFTVNRRDLLKAGAGSGLLGAAALTRTTAAAAQDQPVTSRAGGEIREYWVQADSFLHNLVPTGHDEMMGMTFQPSQTTYWAVGYRAYTPGWGAPLPGDDDIGPNLGIPGPTIRAQVGDGILVHFRNNDTHYSQPHSMHTHGFRYTPASDGGYVAAQAEMPGRAVPTGGTYTYTWTAAASSVGTWPYHDHSLFQGPAGPVMELGAELGLFGVVAITDRRTPQVEREFVLFFHDVYKADVPALAQDFDCFNGAAFLGNTPTFEARVGERIRWRIAALGREFHVFHIHGHRWRNEAGQFIDSQLLGPSTTLTVEFTEDNPGDWLYHCHVSEHLAGGMAGWYKVR